MSATRKTWAARAAVVLDKPEYFFRPHQLALRLVRGMQSTACPRVDVPLLWGGALEVNVRETIGKSLWHLGVFDLVVSEAIWRLLDKGETAADVGANIGYMSCLMSARTGVNGTVWSFEPHPELYSRLLANLGKRPVPTAKAEPRNLALAEQKGGGWLVIPPNFSQNAGLASLSNVKREDAIQVPVARFDEFFSPQTAPVLVKIDVEGKETEVLTGAGSLLEKKLIRDIIFEEHRSYPTDSTSLLEAAGYRVFALVKRFFGPALVAPGSVAAPDWEPRSYLATCDSERALARFRGAGWQVYRGR